MHSKAQTAVDKVEAERLVNVGQVVWASVGLAGQLRRRWILCGSMPSRHPPWRKKRSRNHLGISAEACRK